MCLAGSLLADPSIDGVPEVIDGDSLRINGVDMRLWGIDAPEYRQTCNRDGRTWLCGRDAARALREKLRNRKIRCQPLEVDRHGRQIVRCQLGTESVNRWMVRNGWAIDYRRYSNGEFAGPEREARHARLGLWAGEFQNPEAWRRAHPR